MKYKKVINALLAFDAEDILEIMVDIFGDETIEDIYEALRKSDIILDDSDDNYEDIAANSPMYALVY